MYRNNSIGVVIPCYNEESQIGTVIENMPDFVDKMIIVDDQSKDKTVQIVQDYQGREQFKDKIILIIHEKNQGVGGAIASGYLRARDLEIDITSVMAGDNQMDPKDLPALLDPVVQGECDYSKANRLISGRAYQIIPKVRFFGNSALSLLTKIASGYWHISDSQTGYTAITLKALKTIEPEKIYKRYGMPNDMLVKLNIYDFKVKDVAQEPVYNVGEKSKMKVNKVIFTIGWLLIKLFFFRMKEKYIIRDFHPLIFFYAFGFSLLGLSLPLFLRMAYYLAINGTIPKINFLTWMLCLIMGVQFLLFAMWFDMENGKNK